MSVQTSELAFVKNIGEIRVVNKIWEIPCARNSARKRTLGSSICMTLKRRIRRCPPPSSFVRRVLARKMFHPGENNCLAVVWSGWVERWEGGIGGDARRRTCYDEEISSLVSEDLGEARRGTDWTG